MLQNPIPTSQSLDPIRTALTAFAALTVAISLAAGSAHAREAVPLEEVPAAAKDNPPFSPFEALPEGVLQQIKQKLSTQEQFRFSRQLSKTIHSKLNRVRHLTAQRLRPEERHFHTYRQYYNASRSGHFLIDSVQLEFPVAQDCANFLRDPVARSKVTQLSLGRTCTEALIEEVHTDGETYQAFMEWGPKLEGLALDLSQLQLEPPRSPLIAELFNSVNLLSLKTLKLRLHRVGNPHSLQQLSFKGLAKALSQLPALEHLGLRGQLPRRLFRDLQLRSFHIPLKSFALEEISNPASVLNNLLAPFIAQTAPTLESLTLDNAGESIGPLDALVTAISRAKQLQTLSFSLLLKSPRTRAWNTLFQLQALRSLSFKGGTRPNELPDGQDNQKVEFLSELLQRNSKLESLTLRSLLGSQSLARLSQALRQLTELRSLDLSDSGLLDPTALQLLLNALPSDLPLESLDLSEASIVNHYPVGQLLRFGPPAGFDFSVFSHKFKRLKMLNLNGNYLAQSPGWLRRFAGIAYSCTPTVLSAFEESPLQSLKVNFEVMIDCRERDLAYALNFGDLRGVTELDLWTDDLQNLLDTPFYRAYPVDLRKIRSLRTLFLPDRVLEDPASFQRQFPALETLEVHSESHRKRHRLNALVAALPSGLRFLKVRLALPPKQREWEEIQSALAAKDIRLYHFQFGNDFEQGEAL